MPSFTKEQIQQEISRRGLQAPSFDKEQVKAEIARRGLASPNEKGFFEGAKDLGLEAIKGYTDFRKGARETLTDVGKGAVAGIAELPLGAQQRATDAIALDQGEGTNAGFAAKALAGLAALATGDLDALTDPDIRRELGNMNIGDIRKAQAGAAQKLKTLQTEATERSPIAGNVGQFGAQALQTLPLVANPATLAGAAATGAVGGGSYSFLQPETENLTPKDALIKAGISGAKGAALGAAGGAAGQKLVQSTPAIILGLQKGGGAIANKIGSTLTKDAPILAGKLSEVAKSMSGAIAVTAGTATRKLKENIPFINRPVAEGVPQDIANALDGDYAKQTLSGKLFGSDPESIIEKRLRGRDLPLLREELQNASDVTLADVAGDEVRALTRRVAKASGGARNLVHDFLEGRGAATSDRVIGVLNSKVSNVDNYFQNLDDITALRSKLAKPLYTKAYSEAPSITDPRLNKFLQDKRIIEAQQYAREKLGVRVEASTNSLESLDGVKKALYDIESSQTRQGFSNAANGTAGLRRDLVEILDETSPTYKKARETFGGYSEILNAQELGFTYSKRLPEQIKRELATMTPAQRDAYLIGARQNLEKQVYSVSRSGNEALRVFGKLLQQKQLKEVLGKNFTSFKSKMEKEIKFNDTKNAILGASRSDFNVMPDGDFLETAVDAARGGRLEVTRKVVDAVADSLINKYTGVNERNAKVIAGVLLDNEKSINILDRIIAKQKVTLQKEIVKDIKSDLGG